MDPTGYSWTVYLSNDAEFEYHVLLEHSEFVFATGEVVLIEKNG